MGLACNVLPRNGLHVIRCVLGQIEVAGGGGPARLDWLRFTVTLQVTHVVSAAAMGKGHRLFGRTFALTMSRGIATSGAAVPHIIIIMTVSHSVAHHTTIHDKR